MSYYGTGDTDNNIINNSARDTDNITSTKDTLWYTDHKSCTRHFHIADTQDTTDTAWRHQYPVKFLQVILPSMEQFAYIRSILNPI